MAEYTLYMLLKVTCSGVAPTREGSLDLRGDRSRARVSASASGTALPAGEDALHSNAGFCATLSRPCTLRLRLDLRRSASKSDPLSAHASRSSRAAANVPAMLGQWTQSALALLLDDADEVPRGLLEA